MNARSNNPHRPCAVLLAASCVLAASCGTGGARAPRNVEVRVVSAAADDGALERSPGQGGGPVTLLAATEDVVNELCLHERTCDRVGPGRRFATLEACRKALTPVTRGRLDTNVCQSGFVEPGELVSCLDEIRTASCQADPSAACRPSELCVP